MKWQQALIVLRSLEGSRATIKLGNVIKQTGVEKPLLTIDSDGNVPDEQVAEIAIEWSPAMRPKTFEDLKAGDRLRKLGSASEIYTIVSSSQEKVTAVKTIEIRGPDFDTGDWKVLDVGEE